MNVSLLISLERYVKVASGSFYIMFLAKYLGPEEYGRYSAGLAFVGLLGIFALAGIDGLLQKKLAVDLRHNLVIESFFLLKLLPLLCVIVIYLLWSYFFNIKINSLFIYFTPFLISLIFSFVYQYLIYEERFYKICIVSFSVIIISNIVRFFLFYNNVSLEWFVISYSVEAALFPVGYLTYYLKGKKLFEKKIDFTYIFDLVKEGWGLILSTLIIGSLTKVALLNVESSSSAEDVGRLALLLRIVEAMLILAVSSSMVGMRRLLKAEDDYREVRNNYMIKMYIISILMSLGCYLFLVYLCPVFFGEGYTYSLNVSIISAFLVFFNSVGIYNGRLLVVEGFYKFPLFRNLISLTVFLSINYYYYSMFDLELAMYSLVISWLISSFIFMLLFKKTRRMVLFEFKK
jgi:O-antigen/teichoic acid export membrane protein